MTHEHSALMTPDTYPDWAIAERAQHQREWEAAQRRLVLWDVWLTLWEMPDAPHVVRAGMAAVERQAEGQR